MNAEISQTPTSPKKLRSAVAIAAFVLFWSALTLTFDVVAGWGAVRQILANGYPRVAGRLLKCELEVHHGRGTSYHIDVEYAYEVAGIAYRGTTYRHGFGRTSRDFALPIVQTFFPGKPVEVYYNPSAPADAVLEPGIGGSDLFAAMFMTPFNVIMIGLWGGIYARARYGNTGGFRPRDDGVSQRLALAGWKPVHAAFLAAAGVSFVLVFVIGFPTGMDPSPTVASAAWAVVLLCAAAAWIWSARTVDRDTCDLVIDRASETLTFPVVGNRQEPLRVPWSSISAVLVDPGEAKQMRYVPVAVVNWPDGSRSREALSDPQTRCAANSIAAWIRQQTVRE